MTKHTIVYRNGDAVISFHPEATPEYSAKMFTITVVLQPSGAILLELRSLGTFMSKYLHSVLRDDEMDERMYGGTATWTLFPEEIATIEAVASEVRQRGNWDARYAPGASFTGHDITPEDGFGRYNQGYSQHRYDT